MKYMLRAVSRDSNGKAPVGFAPLALGLCHGNLNTGSVEIRGPVTKEEKRTWDRLSERKRDCDEEITSLQELLKADPENSITRSEIEHERRIREMICKVIPDDR